MSPTDQQIFDTLALFFARESADREVTIVVAPDTDIVGKLGGDDNRRLAP